MTEPPRPTSGAPTRGRTGPGHALAALRRELSVPLFRNTYALMLNTVVNSGFGLLYWVVAARTYPETEVGRGNALTSLMLLVSILTQLNVGQALVRFLPRAGSGSARLIGSAYGLSAGVGVLGAAGVAVYCHLLRPEGDPLHMSAGFGAWFVLSTVLWSLFTVQDSVLTGLRESIWIPLENGLYGVVKLVVLVVVAETSISDGVFTSWTLPVVGLIVPVALLVFRRLLPRHVAATRAVEEPLDRRAIVRYMGGDYAGQVFSQAGSSFLPVLVVALLGSASGAYFLPAQTVFVAINMLTLSITSSLVAEAARDPDRAHLHARAVVRRLALTVLPAAVVMAMAAPWVLHLYGAQYAANATLLLQLFMASVLPRVVVALFMTLNRLRNRTWVLAVLQGVQAAALIGGVVALHGPLGLNAVGWVTLGVELLLALAVLPAVIRWLRGTPR
ncbi:lipopolysaccharide biosynthesis protein [Pseudonocardia oroxyli]|uniref:Membrane protein involved in the export of O-antigen and teichoic acid n=1 Tax=Pseudonocardia oroxyli TaxID=366584 RepID=A0A1G7EC17_PSEOR|nr:oligosaccharide flippase family protein [Pseudonocardia oroxyli]SDE61188.1 Membrane protein involved in the export of O-antigen and teichoic acid [Pseudonocardia oroxyli]